MLGNSTAIATLAVSDMKQAAHFYEAQLGLKVDAVQGDEAVSYKSGAGRIHIYRSAHAGSNKATAATWVVGDSLDDIVRTLKEKGVVFEQYDPPGSDGGDVHGGHGTRLAWFKDPDGNILCLANR
jgi:catechol 2,3-dioxygenase-like lactoylglutathione lyase family enzyme